MKRILLVIFTYFFSINCFALPFERIIFFGDSTTDNGNIYRIFKFIPKSPPYYKGRFSNGPTWAENFADYYRENNKVSSKNYAWGGATAYVHNPKTMDIIAPISLGGELINFYFSNVLTDKSKDLYAFWIGANDYWYERQPDLNAEVDEVINHIVKEINGLIKMGSKNFLVFNMDDLTKTPYGQKNGNIPRLTTLIKLHNEKLPIVLQDIRNKNKNVTITFFDLYAFFDDLIANPEKYNVRYNTKIHDVTTACMETEGTTQNPTGKPCPNPEEYMFWDPMHMSNAFHTILAKVVLEKMPENFK